MSMLTQAELDAMRTTADESLPELADIYRPTNPQPDGAGGRTSTEARVVASVPCRIAPEGAIAGRADDVTGDRLANVQRWQLTFEHGANVEPGDEVHVNARLFTVVSIVARRSYGITTRVSATEVL